MRKYLSRCGIFVPHIRFALFILVYLRPVYCTSRRFISTAETHSRWCVTSKPYQDKHDPATQSNSTGKYQFSQLYSLQIPPKASFCYKVTVVKWRIHENFDFKKYVGQFNKRYFLNDEYPFSGVCYITFFSIK